MPAKFETIILRFRDLVTAENETIKKHKAIIEESSYVWWAWWKKGGEKTPVEEFAPLSVRVTSNPIDVYLVDSGQNLVYRAVCKGIALREEEKMPSPEKEKTPEYYRNLDYCAWFKFTKIEECTEQELREFSYVDCKSLFCNENTDYSKFDNKRIYSISELVQQNRTVWFIRKAEDADRDNEIILLNSDWVQPAHFSAKYHQSFGDTIVWLSDLHLSDNVFPSDGGTPRAALAQHLLRRISDCNYDVAGLLISGDITSRAEENGFQQAKLLLQDVSHGIPILNSENILICPGNHDFARESEDLPENAAPSFIYSKLENTTGFSDFYRSIYNLSPNKFFSSGKKLLLSSGHLLEIAALNSLILQQYPNFDGHGFLSQEQLDFVAEGMGWEPDNHTNTIRMVMMHHHYLPACYAEAIDATKASSVVYDADRLMNWLIKYHVRLLIHGHKHKSFVSQISYPTAPGEKEIAMDSDSMRQVAIVGMGGTGAAGVENKFAAIRFNHGEAVIEFHKIHSDEATPDTVCQTVKILL